ncbi:hypothetical protein [Foetidibacter luteolus]|uniref:hypothetical protein n=1 Tax=Foetidibacter luteolus TaxID=2608880 RepID=UPI00129B563B|nr:hypothetical protein [Foetidibacter luteolus]
MKSLTVILALASSGLAIFAEFRSIKESTLFFDWLDHIPIIILWTLMFIFTFLATKRFISSKHFMPFLPAMICILGLCIVYWHSAKREAIGNLRSVFTAATYQIGSDGGFILDFKKGGHLKGEKRDHWGVTYYWGNYSQNKDTVNINIPLDFKLGRQAILTDTSLCIVYDTIKFDIYKQ